MNDTFYIAVTDSGKASSRRSHLYEDCSTLHENSSGAVKTIGSAEIALLGLKLCSVCEKRQQGGPAIDALEGFFGEDWPSFMPSGDGDPRELAWKLFEYLRERDFYIAKRGKKDAEK